MSSEKKSTGNKGKENKGTNVGGLIRTQIWKRLNGQGGEQEQKALETARRSGQRMRITVLLSEGGVMNHGDAGERRAAR